MPHIEVKFLACLLSSCALSVACDTEEPESLPRGPVTAVAEEDVLVDEDAPAFAGFVAEGVAPEFTVFAAGGLPSEMSEETADFTAASTPALAPGDIAKPAGFGHYCSMTWAGGGWAWAWDTNGNDPCTYLKNQHGAGGTIRKAGLFSASGVNQTAFWCNGTAWGPGIYRGNGTGPMVAAFNMAVAAEQPNCVVTVSPLELPIFDNAPATTGLSPATGIDFARDAAPVMDTAIFGALGTFLNNAATVVNFKGHARSPNNFIDDHDGWDLLGLEGLDLNAMANGVVIANRDYQTTATACPTAAAATAASMKVNPCINRDFPATMPSDCSDPDSAACQAALAQGNFVPYRNAGWDGGAQGEVYVRHQVVASPATYNERFVAIYFHVTRGSTPAVGAAVSAGTKLADLGNGGWTTAPHLHLTVVRETNVGGPAVKDRPIVINADNCSNCAGGAFQNHQYAIDPFGWQAPVHIDPRGWMTTDGAMSPKLWKAGATVWSVGDWGA